MTPEERSKRKIVETWDISEECYDENKKEIEKGLEFKGLVLGYAWSDLRKSLRRVLKI